MNIGKDLSQQGLSDEESSDEDGDTGGTGGHYK